MNIEDHISFHSLPLANKPLLKKWLTKMKRNDPKYFIPTKYSRVCSAHFLPTDYFYFETEKRRLLPDAYPSIFSWTTEEDTGYTRGRRTSSIEKLEEARLEREEATETASEGEGHPMDEKKQQISRKTQTSCDDFDPSAPLLKPCSHSFGVKHLLSKCTTKKKEEKLFKHFTGFNDHRRFQQALNFALPDMNRKHLNYRNSGVSEDIDTSKLYDSESGDECQDTLNVKSGRATHKLSVEDEFLLLMMKLRMGLSQIHLGEHFNISEGLVNIIFLTWINFLYIFFGQIKMWPHRQIILQNSPSEFLEQYPNTIIIIDGKELKIQTPSSLQQHSGSYSHYKSTNTLKSLIGVDPKGGIMFVSQLFEGSISDKQILVRSGFLDQLKEKIELGEVYEGDAIMADKGFDIEKDLADLNLMLNIPPFLRNQVGFEEEDVIKTQSIARHRIHVERAIGKVTRFRIFDSVIPVSMLGEINQIWTVCCSLSNLQNPVLA